MNFTLLLDAQKKGDYSFYKERRKRTDVASKLLIASVLLVDAGELVFVLIDRDQ